jgi:hypothetical protein
MTSSLLNNLMRNGGNAFNIKPRISGTTVYLETYDGNNHSVTAPALVRFPDGTSLEYGSTILPLDVSTNAFGFPADYQGPSPLYVGVAKDGTSLRCVVSADNHGTVSPDGNPVVDSIGCASTGIFTGVSLWTHVLIGWKIVAGVWDLSSAVMEDAK